jgi:hypothetical protein
MLKCGYVNLQNVTDINLERLEKASTSIISPLLVNIALDNFDKYIENIIIPKYTKATMLCNYLESTTSTVEQNYDFFNVANQPLQVEQLTSSDSTYDVKGQSTEQLYYIRYAESILFGFVGSKLKSYTITSEIVAYLQTLGIDINVKHSGVVHNSKGVSFLSYNISGKHPLRTKHNDHVNNPQHCASKSTLHFSAPINILLQRARERGFFMSNRKGRKLNCKVVARRYDK